MGSWQNGSVGLPSPDFHTISWLSKAAAWAIFDRVIVKVQIRSGGCASLGADLRRDNINQMKSIPVGENRGAATHSLVLLCTMLLSLSWRGSKEPRVRRIGHTRRQAIRQWGTRVTLAEAFPFSCRVPGARDSHSLVSARRCRLAALLVRSNPKIHSSQITRLANATTQLDRVAISVGVAKSATSKRDDCRSNGHHRDSSRQRLCLVPWRITLIVSYFTNIAFAVCPVLNIIATSDRIMFR